MIDITNIDGKEDLELGTRENDTPAPTHRAHRRNVTWGSTVSGFSMLAMAQQANQRMNDVMVAEDEDEELMAELLHPKEHGAHAFRFWERMGGGSEYKEKDDPYFDYAETKATSRRATSLTTARPVATLRECQARLENEEAKGYRHRQARVTNQILDMFLNIVADLVIYVVNTLGFESVVIVFNAFAATAYFMYEKPTFHVKLDFALLAIAVIFPLTFLVQATFNRRDLALSRLADFKACVLSMALFKFTVDWAGNGNVGGRLALPDTFNKQVLRDCRELIQLAYEYLSMPSVSHARYIIFSHKQKGAMRVHMLQNDIAKRLNVLFFECSMHTETMRKYGFPSGEASRLHQFNQYLPQRFEQLRLLKYYRTPQATRSFGRVYILLLPWVCGPYFTWVAEETSIVFALVLGGFEFLVLLGLLNAQRALEDPFVAEVNSIFPGIDNVKLDFEMASMLQALEQFYTNACRKERHLKKELI